MAQMDFFAAQDLARRNTWRLLLMLGAATLLMVATINLVVGLILNAETSTAEDGTLHLLVHGSATSLTLLLIGCGILYKFWELRGGGRGVALAFGGRELGDSVEDPRERVLLNVVEEMAIASGMPRPPVFVLDEDGINAFAAGYSPDDAAVAVTRGALEQLSRDELQGVIGHEFSHILNGDMRLNLRLIALLHGLLLIGLTGATILRLLGRMRSRRSDGRVLAVLLLIGLALMIIGYAGVFLGSLIRAAISRQREYLADAASVQFTRNPLGIAGALRHIADKAGVSLVAHERTEEAAHLFFCRAVKPSFFSLFASHPPLEERIRRLMAESAPAREPVPAPPPTAAAITPPAAHTAFAGPQTAPARRLRKMSFTAETAVAGVGNFGERQLEQGRAFLARLPEALAQATRDPFSARAALLVTVLDPDPAQAERQIALLAASDAALGGEIRRLAPAYASLDADEARYPLVTLCLGSLRRLTADQRKAFLAMLDEAVRLDGRLSPAEFIVVQLVRASLSLATVEGAGRVRAADLTALFGLLARAGSTDETEAQAAYAAGWQEMQFEAPALPSALTMGDAAAAALDRLAQVAPGVKRRLVTACARIATKDGTITLRESEMLRAICARLGCPLPPLLSAA